MVPSLTRPSGASGDLMIQSVHIRNFRCFEEASLQDCRTLNVVVGKNASGKTALLEALFLAVGPSPEIALGYRAWHGYEGAHQGTPQDIDEAVWGDLFHRFERDRVVSVALEGTGRHTRTLTIEWSRERSLNPVFDPGSRQIGIPSAAIFKWTRGNEPPFTVQPISTPGMGYQFPGAEGY